MGRKRNVEIQELHDYLQETADDQEKKVSDIYREFAVRLDISYTHLCDIVAKRRSASLVVVNRVLQETHGQVGIKELRPDLYAELLKFAESKREKGVL